MGRPRQGRRRRSRGTCLRSRRGIRVDGGSRLGARGPPRAVRRDHGGKQLQRVRGAPPRGCDRAASQHEHDHLLRPPDRTGAGCWRRRTCTTRSASWPPAALRTATCRGSTTATSRRSRRTDGRCCSRSRRRPEDRSIRSACAERTDRLWSGWGTAPRKGFSPDGTWALALVHSTPPRIVLYPTGAGAARELAPGCFPAS
jgi:hypothetical protein